MSAAEAAAVNPDAAVAWLREQIHARLESACKATPGPWEFEGDDPTDEEVFDVADCRPVAFTRGRQVANGQHIAANDPRQIIADCEADLAIVASHKPAYSPEDRDFTGIPCAEDERLWPCRTVKAVASAYRHSFGYADHWGSE